VTPNWGRILSFALAERSVALVRPQNKGPSQRPAPESCSRSARRGYFVFLSQPVPRKLDSIGLTGFRLFLRSRLRRHRSGYAVIDHQLAVVFGGVFDQLVS